MTDDIDTTDGREERPAWDQAILVRAHEVIKRIITKELITSFGDKFPAADEMTDQHVVAFAYGILCNDMARVLGTWPPVTKSTCAWCVAAAGDTKEARDASPVYTHSEARQHVLTCTNNPLVAELAAIDALVVQDALRNRYDIDIGGERVAPFEDNRSMRRKDLIASMVEEITTRDQEALDAAESGFAMPAIADELGLEDDSPEAIRTEIQRLRKVELEKLDEKVERDLAFDKQRIQVLADELAEHFPIAITARAFMNDEATMKDLREISDAVGNAAPALRRTMLPPRLLEVIDGDPVHRLHELLWMIGECVRGVPRTPTIAQLVNALRGIETLASSRVDDALEVPNGEG